YGLTGGGDVVVSAQRNVLSRRDLALIQQLGSNNRGGLSYPWVGATNLPSSSYSGMPDQAWRVVNMTMNGVLNTSINPELFREGLGALGGGDIRLQAGANVSDITTVVDTSQSSILTALPDGTPTNPLVTVGGGDVAIRAAGDIAAARIHAGSGAVQLAA